jgi:hypothetical protein
MKSIQISSHKIYALATLLLLTAFVISCYGTALGRNVIQAHIQSQSEGHAICCSVEQNEVVSMAHGQTDFNLPLLQLLVIAFVSLASAMIVFGLQTGIGDIGLRLYERVIRTWYGSAKIFYSIIEQFRRGLLHPKIF